jgi:hypothetical protein
VIRWLEENPVGQAFSAVAVVLVLTMLLLGVVWTMPPTGGSGEEEGGGEALRLDVPELPASEPMDAYAVVTERPVFNESRQPELGLDSEQDELGDLEENNVDAPELELAGVIITPSIRMVTLRQKEAGESLVAFEGQPLQGDYGSWHVSRIAPREITLASGDGEEMQLQLQVHDDQIAPPPKPKPEPGEADTRQAAAASAESDAPLSRAEEIRQRIQERREELRRAAEEASEDGSSESADYRTAIQSMINTTSRKGRDEDDQ